MPILLTPYEHDLAIDSPRMANARRPDHVRLPRGPEHVRDEDADLISLVALWGRMSKAARQLRLYHGHNEGKLAGGGREWRMRRRKGTMEGIPDLMIYHRVDDYTGVAIEMKRADQDISAVSDEQAAWLLHLRKEGWLAEWCRGFAEADAFLRLCYG